MDEIKKRGMPNIIAHDLVGVSPMSGPLDLNAMAARVHKANAKWWVDLHTGEKLERNKGELLMLMVSEVAEAMEGERKSKPGKPKMDDKLPDRPMAEVEMADTLIRALDFAGGFNIPIVWEIEPNLIQVAFAMTENRAESLLRLSKRIGRVYQASPNRVSYAISYVIMGCFEYCEKFGYDLMGAYEAKMIYNATRADHSIEHRKADGGKQW